MCGLSARVNTKNIFASLQRRVHQSFVTRFLRVLGWKGGGTPLHVRGMLYMVIRAAVYGETVI